ncbi:hypothetical protein BRDID11002_23770 [Bradyrhizobium diazoefficiens]
MKAGGTGPSNGENRSSPSLAGELTIGDVKFKIRLRTPRFLGANKLQIPLRHSFQRSKQGFKRKFQDQRTRRLRR